MIIYLSMFLVLLLVFLFANKREGFMVSKVVVAMVWGYMIFWIGMRNRFVDTAAYIKSFNSATWDELSSITYSFDSGWGFRIAEILFRNLISENYHYWLMFIAVVTGTCIASIFRRYSANFFFSTFLFLSATTFTWMMNGIRQFLAVAILFACTHFLVERKWWKYFIAVLLCSTIHATCIIMIPLYFVAIGKPWSKKTLAFIGLILLVTLFSSSTLEAMDAMLQNTKWANSADKFQGDDGVNPLRVLVFSVVPLLAFFKRNILNTYGKGMDVLVNMSLITAGIYLIGMVTSGIMIGRLPMYAQLYQYLLLPYIIEKGFTIDNRRFIYFWAVSFYFLYFYLMTRTIYYSSDFTGFIN